MTRDGLHAKDEHMRTQNEAIMRGARAATEGWKHMTGPSGVKTLAWRIEGANRCRQTFVEMDILGLTAGECYSVAAASLHTNRTFLLGDKSFKSTHFVGSVDASHTVHWGALRMPEGIRDRDCIVFCSEFPSRSDSRPREETDRREKEKRKQ